MADPGGGGGLRGLQPPLLAPALNKIYENYIRSMHRSKENVVERWNVLWCGKKQELDSGESGHSDTSLPDNLLQALGTCDKDSFPNIHCLLVIACTLPISSAEAERSFSLLRRVKTYMRSTMSEECLSDLSVIAMHYGEWV